MTKKKYDLKGLLPGIVLDEMSDSEWKEHKKDLKEAMKSDSSENIGMKEIHDFIFEVDKHTKKTGLPAKDSLDIPPEHLESIYSLAHNLYENGKYDEAANLFRLLIMIDHFEYKYHFGLAACMQMLEDYLKACTAYMMAASIDIKTPLPHYHAAECFLKMQEPGSACISLDLAIEAAGNQKEFSILKERCLLTREKLIKYLRKRLKDKKLNRLKKGKGKKKKND